MSLSIAAATAAVWVLAVDKESRVDPHEIESFKKRVEFSRLSEVHGVDGVWVDWGELPRTVMPPRVKGQKLELPEMVAVGPGIAKREFVWTKGNAQTIVSVFVSGAGYQPVHETLLSLVSETTRVDIPFEAGPPGLGDLSIRNIGHPSDSVIWVFRNVCVEVRDLEGGDVEPIARKIQRFMEAHVALRLADHLPRVDRVEISARQIRVGEEWQLSVALGKGTAAGSVRSQIDEVSEDRLDVLRRASFSAAYRGREPGTGRIEIRIVDRKTLLSSPLSATVDVLPAR